MKRIIYVPQYPTQMRYSEWWYWKFELEFKKRGYEVYTLGANKLNELQLKRGNSEMFSPIDASIEFECAQINEYMEMEIKNSDILFLSDISFPGIFPNVLFHKYTKNMYAFCHATSLNFQDYFSKQTPLKFPIESSHSKLFKSVFVGSEYHKEKLGWKNTVVTYLPYHPFITKESTEKYYDIISVSRPTPQKVDSVLEKKVEERFSPIVRKEFNAWKGYFNFLNESKILLITSHEDTFGLQIVDAVTNDCIPLAPNRCAYPEILPKEYLYDSEEELYALIDRCLAGEMEVPKLICDQEMKNFYNRIVDIIETDPS
ncbi:MAG: hypothetical protein K9L62_10970 [Vallitaleaceae bacterium]|nr:hypothetical protein [Vallitaleaceae bacterium]